MELINTLSLIGGSLMATWGYWQSRRPRTLRINTFRTYRDGTRQAANSGIYFNRDRAVKVLAGYEQDLQKYLDGVYDGRRVEWTIETDGSYLTDSMEFEIFGMCSFKLVQLPGCCGVVVSTGAFVDPRFRRKGLGKLLNTIRQHLARELGYGYILCTDVAQNTAQRRLLESQHWIDLTSFVNPRTGNTVYITGKEL